MMEVKPVYIISDNPELKAVKFGYDAYARTIAGIVANKANKTPMVIGVFGSWGSGKTTLMRAVIDTLTSDAMHDKSKYRKTKTVWFQAWKYANEDEILAGLIEEIFKTIKSDSLWGSIKAHIEELIKSVDIIQGVQKLAKEFIGVDVNTFMREKLAYKDKLGFYDTFQDFFDRLLWIYLNDRPQKNINEKVDDAKTVLVIFIDDLDRCPKPRVLKVLETIKLFMDKPGCVFVIGAASEIIESALKETYGNEAHKFMDKIVQVTFNLPLIPTDTLKELVQGLDIENREQIMESLAIVAPVLENNPRRIKRFLNNLNLQLGIIQNKGIEIAFESLLNWSIIEYVYPSLVKKTKVNPYFVLMLKEEIDKIEVESERDTLEDLSKDILEKVPLPLHEYMVDRNLWQVMKNFPCDIDCIKQLVTLHSLVQIKEEKTLKQEKEIGGNFDDMVEIPIGSFLYGDYKQKVTIKNPYLIDVYPTTNFQYEKFIKAGGYEKEEFWSSEGIEWKKREKISLPKFWNDEKCNKPDHPVVGVSWFEAEAYSKWVGKRLTAEVEWERAARSTDGRRYPWGDSFDKAKCNSMESGIEHTTPVTQYPNGRSQDNCYDMVGNVWEWCVDWYSVNEGRCVVRGGSWSYLQLDLRCALRSRVYPHYRSDSIGFRCSR